MYASRCHTAGTSLVSTRIIGLWVPAEMFGNGGFIEVRIGTTTDSATFQLSIGGDGNSVGGGVIDTWTAGPLSFTHMLRSRVVFEGTGPYDFVSKSNFGGGSWFGITGAPALGYTASVHTQPLNFVELSTVGTFTIQHASILVVGPDSPTLRTPMGKVSV